MSITEYDRSYAKQQLYRSRHPLRQLIKCFYLNNILCDVCGPTIDFGCGAGQLLAKLPAGSIGIEVNPYLVKELRVMELNVAFYEPDIDGFSLPELPRNHYKTLVMAHVLEHFTDAALVLDRLFHCCDRLGIRRVVLVVPGAKGFQSDATHKTFVNEAYIKEHGFVSCKEYKVSKFAYFPFNIKLLGDYFVFHELKIVYDLSEPQ